MSEKTKRRRIIPTTIAILVVMLAIPFLLILRISSFFRRNIIDISDLKFPVLVIRPVGSPYAVWDADTFRNISRTSTRIPRNGMILVDSDFTLATLENVSCNTGDFGSIARALFPGVGYRYSFQLRRNKTTGLAVGLKCLLDSESLGPNADDAPVRRQLAGQTTMDGILNTLQLYKPEPAMSATEPAATEPSTTEPATTAPETNEPDPASRK